MLSTREHIGRLDRRIVIEEPVNVSDIYNQPVSTTWSEVATVWANMHDGVGSEDYQADQLTAQRITTFTIRYRTGLRETMRVLFEGRYYNIQGIKSPDRKRTLELRTILLDEEEVVVEGAFSSSFSDAYNS